VSLPPTPGRIGRPPRSAARSRRRRIGRLAGALLLGSCCALLVSCGSSGKGLIPTADAGPLQSDFEAVAHAAETGDGKCSITEAAIAKTEQDYSALPSSLDSGLRNTLSVGIKNLSKHARELCLQPLSSLTTTGTTATTTTSTTPTTSVTIPTTTTTVPSTPTTTTPPTTTTEQTPGGGGTESPPVETKAPGGGGGVGVGGGVGAEGPGNPEVAR
jgi:hypothetical protein